MKFKKEILLTVASLAVSLILAEIGVRLFTDFPVHEGTPFIVDHPSLGYSLNSKRQDIDLNGFRNPKAQTFLHDIVALGDSHTYGINAVWDDAWPYQLGRSLDKSVYNYGVGGYGIYHYFYLAERAIRHQPDYVLLGLYPANDIDENACGNVAPEYYFDLRKMGLAKVDCRTTPAMVWKNVMVAATKYSALVSASYHLRFLYLKSQAAQDIYNASYFDVGGVLSSKRGVFKQAKATELSRKEVRGNFESSKAILSSIRDNLKANGIKFGVVIIPSKERVIEQWALNKSIEVPEGFSAKNQKDLIEKYLAFFDEKDIPAIDTSTLVVASFTESQEANIEYYPFWDDHPYAKGYEVYSRAAEELITNIDQKWTEDTRANNGETRSR